MKQTAVEWLVYQLHGKQQGFNSNSYNSIIEQAKEMEKQQIINACNQDECLGSYGFKGYEDITKGNEYYNLKFK